MTSNVIQLHVAQPVLNPNTCWTVITFRPVRTVGLRMKQCTQKPRLGKLTCAHHKELEAAAQFLRGTKHANRNRQNV